MTRIFHGSITALVTPFQNGDVDLKAFENFVEWQIQEGSHGVVPCGTTGESPTLEYDEMKRIFDVCVQTVKASGKKLPVIAGTGTNSTAKTIELSKMAEQRGADALLIVAPYYNKPTQDGLYAHFKAIHDATDLPIVVYNIPGRSIVEITVDTMLRLAELPRIMGLKDATSDTGRTTLIRAKAKDNFAILSGEDAIAGAFLAQGADGCISVASNAAPALCSNFQDAWAKGNLEEFSRLQTLLAPLHKALFVESSPSPVKYALSRLGLSSDEVRLPLLPASAHARKIVDEALAIAGLLSNEEGIRARA